MTQEEKKSTRKSSLDTLIEELDEMYIKNGWKVPEWAEPDPTRHKIIVRMPRQQKAWGALFNTTMFRRFTSFHN